MNGLDAAELRVRGLCVDYEGVNAVSDVDLDVAPGTAVALLGPNGAGKTTTLRSIAGLVRDGVAGVIEVDGQPIGEWNARRRAGLGVSFVPEGRAIFPSLTVAENLELFAMGAERSTRESLLDDVFDVFPPLGARRRQRAASLSGGEQQMLALSRVILAKPRLLIIDEMSLGLAPILVTSLFDVLGAIRHSGCTVLFTEQFIHHAVNLADSIFVMKQGRIVFRASTDSAPGGHRTLVSQIHDLYLGDSESVQADYGREGHV